MKLLRYAYRLPLLLGHVLLGIVLALLLLNPLSRRLFSERPENRLVPWWSRLFLRVFGVRVRCAGDLPERVALVVANHLSWLDIEVLHSIRLMAFVAKAEISRWPLVGWMAGRAGTIYHRRGSPESLRGVSEAMAGRLRDGWTVALFPEGRVGGGGAILPFHGRLFQCAVETGSPVRPVALRYVEADGSVNTSTPFRRGESFLVNLLRLMGRRRTIAVVRFCERLDSVSIDGRRALAQQSRDLIVQALDGRTRTDEATREDKIHDYTSAGKLAADDDHPGRRASRGG